MAGDGRHALEEEMFRFEREIAEGASRQRNYRGGPQNSNVPQYSPYSQRQPTVRPVNAPAVNIPPVVVHSSSLAPVTPQRPTRPSVNNNFTITLEQQRQWESQFESGASTAVAAAVATASSASAAKKESASKDKSVSKVKDRKMLRMAGGQVWEDNTLVEWDPNDFRLFCGDLGNEVTEEVLQRIFAKYPSLQKVKVVRDKRTNKTKGYGFVSFRDSKDYLRAMKELNGKYVGNRPIKLRKSAWKDRSLEVVKKKDREKKRLGFR